MIIIPAIDLRGGRCVRLVQGRANDATVYDADPVETARDFAASGAELLHIVDLDAAFGVADSGNAAVIERIVGEVQIPVVQQLNREPPAPGEEPPPLPFGK